VSEWSDEYIYAILQGEFEGAEEPKTGA